MWLLFGFKLKLKIPLLNLTTFQDLNLKCICADPNGCIVSGLALTYYLEIKHERTEIWPRVFFVMVLISLNHEQNNLSHRGRDYSLFCLR